MCHAICLLSFNINSFDGSDQIYQAILWFRPNTSRQVWVQTQYINRFCGSDVVIISKVPSRVGPLMTAETVGWAFFILSFFIVLRYFCLMAIGLQAVVQGRGAPTAQPPLRATKKNKFSENA